MKTVAALVAASLATGTLAAPPAGAATRVNVSRASQRTGLEYLGAVNRAAPPQNQRCS